MADFRQIDPAELRLPPSRYLSGADPYKLQQQIARFGASLDGMPPIWVYEGADGVLEIIDGTTRATRAAKLAQDSKFGWRSSASCVNLADSVPGSETGYDRG